MLLDANVLVSGAVSSRGAVDQLLAAWRIEGRVVVVTSEWILDEVTRALRRPYFASRLADRERDTYVELVRRGAHVVVPWSDVHGVAPDPDDDQILAAAVDGRADYLVTGDAALLALGTFRGVRIVRARELIDLLQ